MNQRHYCTAHAGKKQRNPYGRSAKSRFINYMESGGGKSSYAHKTFQRDIYNATPLANHSAASSYKNRGYYHQDRRNHSKNTAHFEASFDAASFLSVWESTTTATAASLSAFFLSRHKINMRIPSRSAIKITIKP